MHGMIGFTVFDCNLSLSIFYLTIGFIFYFYRLFLFYVFFLKKVHRDSGLITLIPKSTCAGLEILSKGKRDHWISLEDWMNEGDIAVYIGRSLEKLTGGLLPGTIHRVVRYPGKERFSSPFELKPNQNVLLKPWTESSAVSAIFEKGLENGSPSAVQLT